MIARFPVFSERLAADWAETRRAAEKAIHAYALIEEDEAEAPAFIDSAALNLHGFYSGLERIFEWLARQLDGTVPEGSTWHQDLLMQMSLDVPGVRPAVIQAETRKQLRDYLGFRHIVRNLYTWDLEVERIEELINRLPAVLQALDEDLVRFQQFLEEAGRADEAAS